MPRAVPVGEGTPLPRPARRAARGGRFAGRAGELCEVFAAGEHLLLVGTGTGGERALLDAGARAACRLAAFPAIALDARGLSAAEATALAAGAWLRSWRYQHLRTRPAEDAPRLAAFELVTAEAASVAPAWARAEAVLRGVCFARDLVAEPGCTLTPAGFVERLAPLAAHGITISVLGPRALRAQGFGALLAVGAGAATPPRLAVLRWKGRLKAPPIAFVGKGITFDTGGLSHKPARGMERMSGDMAGAAACAGAILALALRRSPAPAVAVLALAENAIGAASYRPGDVLRSHAGRTIEVVDTDAEGRLALADALSWTRQTCRPRAMIDLATLTGSVVTTLGHHMAGLFDNDPVLGAWVAAAGVAVGEPVWKLPIDTDHRAALDSDIADLRQCAAGRLLPDACHAAAFLREFAGGTRWAHLDIAGVARREEPCELLPAGPTGFGVRLLDRLVAMRFEDVD